MSPTHALTIAQVAVRLRQGLRSRALVEEALELIDTGGGAYVSVAAARARADAADSDRRLAAGAPRSLLEGVPVSVKDLFDVEGEVTAAGALALRGAPAARADAAAVAALRRAGAVVLGRTHMSAFAFTALGANPHLPPCPNPHDAARVPGGSSSGAAVSVALGQAFMGLGSDTGGSVRIPASFCGIVGFKPTQWRVPREGAFVLSPTQDSIGPLARSVECCAIVDAILADRPDAALPVPPLAGLRLALPREVMMDGLDAHVAARFDHALGQLRRAGVEITQVSFPHFSEAPELFSKGTLVNAEAFRHHRALGLLERREAYDPIILARIDMGGQMAEDDVGRIMRARQRMMAETSRLAAGHDAIVLPTTPNVAPRFADIADAAGFNRENGRALRNTSLFNFLDRCAISLPVDAGGGLPVGLMLVGETMEDRRLLAVAQAVEGGLAG